MRPEIGHLAEGGVLGTFIDRRGYPIVQAASTASGLGSLYRSAHQLLQL